MGNRDQAKQLRERQAGDEAEQTAEALASTAQGKQDAVAIAKVQEDLDNTKSQLSDVKAEKEALEVELETAVKSEVELKALVEKKDVTIAALEKDAITSKEESIALAKEVTALKKELTALKKK